MSAGGWTHTRCNDRGEILRPRPAGASLRRRAAASRRLGGEQRINLGGDGGVGPQFGTILESKVIVKVAATAPEALLCTPTLVDELLRRRGVHDLIQPDVQLLGIPPLTYQILSISGKPQKVGLLAYQPVVKSPMAYQPVVKSLMAKKHLFFLRLPNVGLPGHPIQFYFRNGAQMIIQILLRDIGADDRAGDMCLRASCLALAHVTSFLCRLPFACVCILNITVTTLVVLLLRGFAKKWALKKTTRQMSGL